MSTSFRCYKSSRWSKSLPSSTNWRWLHCRCWCYSSPRSRGCGRYRGSGSDCAHGCARGYDRDCGRCSAHSHRSSLGGRLWCCLPRRSHRRSLCWSWSCSRPWCGLSRLGCFFSPARGAVTGRPPRPGRLRLPQRQFQRRHPRRWPRSMRHLPALLPASPGLASAWSGPVWPESVGLSVPRPLWEARSQRRAGSLPVSVQTAGQSARCRPLFPSLAHGGAAYPAPPHRAPPSTSGYRAGAGARLGRSPSTVSRDAPPPP